jgi:hypothetical protein
MESKSAANYRLFANLLPSDTTRVRPRVRYRRIDEDTLALILALTGLAIMTITAASMLVAFAVL